jgi:hypothetical protein
MAKKLELISELRKEFGAKSSEGNLRFTADNMNNGSKFHINILNGNSFSDVRPVCPLNLIPPYSLSPGPSRIALNT